MAIATSTIAITGAVLAIVAAGISAYSAVEQASAAEDAAKYNATVARNNAAAAAAQSSVEAGRARNRSRRLIAAQKTQFAKSGGTLSGSAIDVLYDTAIQAETDALSIEYRGAIGGNNHTAESRLQSMMAKNAKASVAPAVTGSILGGLSGAAGSYSSVKGPKEPRIGDY